MWRISEDTAASAVDEARLEVTCLQSCSAIPPCIISRVCKSPLFEHSSGPRSSRDLPPQVRAAAPRRLGSSHVFAQTAHGPRRLNRPPDLVLPQEQIFKTAPVVEARQAMPMESCGRRRTYSRQLDSWHRKSRSCAHSSALRLSLLIQRSTAAVRERTRARRCEQYRATPNKTCRFFRWLG